MLFHTSTAGGVGSPSGVPTGVPTRVPVKAHDHVDVPTGLPTLSAKNTQALETIFT